jgi:transcriptional regulator with XRE-family HTH domain
MPDPTEGPTVLRILLGTQLRRLRESRGISALAAAKAIRGSESKISRIELGRNAIREIDVLDLLTFYGVGPVEREQLLILCSRLNVTLQIIRSGLAGHAVPSGFTILRFGEPDLPDVAYLEHVTSAVYFDKKSDVDRYLLTMERLSIVSAKPSQTPGILTAIIDQLNGELG